MVASQQSLPERRTRSLSMIRKVVNTRQSMLSLFNALAKKKPFTDEDEALELLADFCAALVDYTANAHFQLYRFFAENRERRGDVHSVVDRIYPRIAEITQIILDFNDKYDTHEQRRQNLSVLANDLSKLGEKLAERIDLEDELVDLLTSSREPVRAAAN